MEIQIGFNFLSKFIQLEVWLFLVGLISSVFLFIITKKINTRGLLFEADNRTYSPEKLQLLILSWIFVAVYLIEVRYKLSSCKVSNSPCSLPEIRPEFLFVLGGSNFVYLWGKLSSIIRERRSKRA